jgi:hypothetical protein
MELSVSYLYEIQLRTHAALLLELFSLNDPHERKAVNEYIRFLIERSSKADINALHVGILGALAICEIFTIVTC